MKASIICILRDDFLSAEKTIRNQARATLRGGWMKAIAALLILFAGAAFVDCVISLLSFLFNHENQTELWLDVLNYSVTPVVGFITAFLISPLFNGYIRVFYRAAENNSYDISDMFYYFQKGHYGKALSININLVLRMILPTIIAFSPVIIYIIICEVNEYDFPAMSFFLFILSVLSTLITVLWSFKYFLVYIYAVDFEYLSARELFKFSKEMMRGKTGMAAKLLFSFFPWLLLSLTILPILYTAPYITQAMCISAKWIARSNIPTTQVQEG